ncbi:MAG: HupE/UreJ family protein [Deltaproteobacteria bacterium]|nr:HupE/UreJ family protein [Deltaproteobacteria bacterium]
MKALCFIVAASMWAATAWAHKPSDSYLMLQVHGARIDGQWDVALRDIDFAVGLDANNDGAITWGEVRLRQAAIASYALSHLEAKADGASCTNRPIDQLIDSHSDGAYVVLRFHIDCPAQIRQVDLHYSLLFDLDAQHRGITNVTTSDATRTILFSPDHANAAIDVGASAVWQSLDDFWREGVWHIWTGFDHILFLLSLLMPAVLRRDAGRWRSVDGFAPAFKETVKVVSAFTVAHSITLSLAAFGTVHLSSRLVESAIAASVVVAALNNSFAVFGEARWVVGFGFGLLHGLGFASVLADPGLVRGQLLLALIGFNAGVETGQLAIVSVFLPVAYTARGSWFYQRLTMQVGSSLIAAVALVWMIERLLGLRLLS